MTTTEERRNTRIMRVSGDLYRAVKRVANNERRPMNAQLQIFVEEGMRSLGYGGLDDAAASEREPTRGAA